MSESDTPADRELQSPAARAIVDAADGDPDQTVGYLARYAESGELPPFHNARTYLEGLELAEGEVALEQVAEDTHAADGGWFYFADGEFVYRIGEHTESKTGADAIASFAHNYDDDGMELVPVHIDETPIPEEAR